MCIISKNEFIQYNNNNDNNNNRLYFLNKIHMYSMEASELKLTPMIFNMD